MVELSLKERIVTATSGRAASCHEERSKLPSPNVLAGCSIGSAALCVIPSVVYLPNRCSICSLKPYCPADANRDSILFLYA